MTDIEKGEMFYEGKAKRLFKSNRKNVIVQEFKDSLTAFNAQKKGSFEGKGRINLRITNLIFEYLKKQGIPSHQIGLLDETHMVCQSLDMIPLEVVVRNTVAGSLGKRLGLKDGEKLSEPVIEFYYKSDRLGDPLVTTEHIKLLKLCTFQEVETLKSLALSVNKALINMFSEINIDLVDFKIEFGRNELGEIVLADEITPDSCRLWDKTSGERLDKDRFRQDLGKVEESYNEVVDRIVKKWS